MEMSKNYKYKEYKEKDSQDKDRLSKSEKRAIEGSNRQKAKLGAKIELEEYLEAKDNPEDNYWQNESKMSSLCCQAEYLASKKGIEYKCTCPNPANDKLSLDHIDYLNSFIAKLNNGDYDV